MTTTRIPLAAQINVTIVSQAVTAAYGGAGDLVNYSAACSSVLLRNPGEVWPIEFKVGSGAWQRLAIYNTTLLGISLDTTTIRVRKASANSGSGLVQLDIRGLASSTYLAGDEAVDLGGATGPTGPAGSTGATGATGLTGPAGSFAHAAPSSITVTASPFTYRNTTGTEADVVVLGGVVALIQRSRDNSTFYSLGAIVSGQFHLSDGDYLKITYSSSPTMTMIPF